MAALTSYSPLTARRRLGSELRLLRDQNGLTTEDVGTQIGCHNSKISRIETGKRTCTLRDFEALMDLYEVDGPKLEELTDLLRRARQRVPPWWHAYGDVISANYAEFLAYEAEATMCCEYQSLHIPAQLQSADYARAVTAVGFAALGPDQVDSLVEVRLRRQERMRETEPMRLECVVTEAALRFRVGGPQVMTRQLRLIREAAVLPHVSVAVIPFAAGENGMTPGAFTLFGTGSDGEADVAFTESAEGTSFRDDPLTLRRLRRLFRSLSESALRSDEGLELIERIEKEVS
jgi:transcriptional regulator with XRE-family HTH domain